MKEIVWNTDWIINNEKKPEVLIFSSINGNDKTLFIEACVYRENHQILLGCTSFCWICSITIILELPFFWTQCRMVGIRMDYHTQPFFRSTED